MHETVRFLYYDTGDGCVKCKAVVNRIPLEVKELNRDMAREAMIRKVKATLTDNANECEDVEIKY